MAVAHGQARHVVVYRTVKEGSAARAAGGRPAYGSTKPEAEGPLAWLLPVGMLSPVVQVAPTPCATCTTSASPGSSSGWIPVVQRRHAGRNPDAVYREPLTIDDYLAVPHDLDADVPLRLRRARRRRHRHRRVRRRDHRPTCGPRSPSKRWPGWSTAGRRGSSGRTCQPGRPRHRRAPCGTARR